MIEGQEAGLFAVKLGSHQYFGEVGAEESEDTAVELKTHLFIVAVIHPLLFGVIHALPLVLVLQLKGKDGDAVDRQHHIDAVVVFGGVIPLPVAGDDILLIKFKGGLIQF